MRIGVALALGFVAAAAGAATPAQEKAFVETYRKAYEAKDERTLASLLYTRGADPAAVAFYKMMMGAEAGSKITSIELVEISPEDRKRIDSMQSPDGKPAKLVLPPGKKLVIKSETRSASGSSSGKSEIFVGEADGKLYILVPAASR
jgi:hypothetical protein